MIYSYFPGCTLKTKGKDLDIYGRQAAEKLGITLEELPEWQCCGGVFVSAKDEIASKLPSVRALVSARDIEQPLVDYLTPLVQGESQVQYKNGLPAYLNVSHLAELQ